MRRAPASAPRVRRPRSIPVNPWWSSSRWPVTPVAHVVLVASLLLRRAMKAIVRILGVVAIVRSRPGFLDSGIRRAHRVIVEVPPTGSEVLEDLSKQTLLPVIGHVVDAHRAHDRVKPGRNRRGPAARRHVELDVLEASRERLHLGRARSHHLRREVGENGGAPWILTEDPS